ncbi:hypothetical protein ACFQ9X_21965 [Catenulispora yoronensis]
MVDESVGEALHLAMREPVRRIGQADPEGPALHRRVELQAVGALEIGAEVAADARADPPQQAARLRLPDWP